MEALRQWAQGLPPWAFDFVRFGNGLLLLAAIFVPLEKLFALRPKAAFRAGWRLDLLYYFLTSLLPNRLIVLPVLGVIGLLQFWAPQGLFPSLAQWPSWARFPLALVVAELGFYWGHRWLHASPRLWRFHALHHGATELDWLVNTRAHPLDLLLIRLCGLLPLYVLGVVQIGAHRSIDGLPLMVTLLASAWGYFIHANVRWRLGWFEQVLATPAFHHWHHQHLGNQGHQHGNYAAMLPLLDRLFGTLHLPAQAWPERYGTDEALRTQWVDQLMAPFMEILDGTGKRRAAKPSRPDPG